MSMETSVEQLCIAAIRRDGGTQPRAQLDVNIAAEYAEAMQTGAQFPPVVVFYDGTDHWLADGFHRAAAAESVHGTDAVIAAEVHQGTRRDALLYSTGANATHGVRRTNHDKRRAVMTLLRDAEWATWSDREIARQCAVIAPSVSKLRDDLALTVNHLQSPLRRGADGRTINTTNIGSKPRLHWTLAPANDDTDDTTDGDTDDAEQAQSATAASATAPNLDDIEGAFRAEVGCAREIRASRSTLRIAVDSLRRARETYPPAAPEIAAVLDGLKTVMATLKKIEDELPGVSCESRVAAEDIPVQLRASETS
jgi:hypothetical protein